MHNHGEDPGVASARTGRTFITRRAITRMEFTFHTLSGTMDRPSDQRPLLILVDGLCPICKHEGRVLQRLDRGRNLIALDDITRPGFDPGHFGLTQAQVMGSIHAITPDGRVLRGMEVFRAAYARLGWGWLWAPTGWPVLRPIFDALYRVFAKVRPRLSGYKPCEGDRCAIK